MASRTSLRTYAQAYVGAIPEHTDAIKETARTFFVLRSVPELASFLEDPSIPQDDKRKALMIAIPDADEETLNFILLLSSERLLGSLESIGTHVKEAFAEREERAYAELASAVPLTNEEVTRVATALGARIGKPVLLETVIDESVMGGIRVRVGDWVFDASLAGRLQRLKHTLHV